VEFLWNLNKRSVPETNSNAISVVLLAGVVQGPYVAPCAPFPGARIAKQKHCNLNFPGPK